MGREGEQVEAVDGALDEAFAVVWQHLVDERPGEVAAGAGPADALFCFGSRDRTVPAVAAELYRRGVAPVVLVSGGGVVDGGAREADAFARDLVSLGVPGHAIAIERSSRHTGENVVEGMAVLRDHLTGATTAGGGPGAVRSLVTVSWPLAARRCRATFAQHHPEVAVRSAPAVDGGRRWAPTDRTVRAALGELDRLRDYAARGFVAADPAPVEVEAAAGVLRRWCLSATAA